MFIGDTSASSKATGLPFVETSQIPSIAVFLLELGRASRSLTAIRSACVRIAYRLGLSPRMPMSI